MAQPPHPTEWPSYKLCDLMSAGSTCCVANNNGKGVYSCGTHVISLTFGFWRDSISPYAYAAIETNAYNSDTQHFVTAYKDAAAQHYSGRVGAATTPGAAFSAQYLGNSTEPPMQVQCSNN